MKATGNHPGQGPESIARRKLLMAGAGVAAGSLLSAHVSAAQALASQSSSAVTSSLGTRKLGALEVSSLGLGVQNMSRTYPGTVPYKPEMINIIRTAFELGRAS